LYVCPDRRSAEARTSLHIAYL